MSDPAKLGAALSKPQEINGKHYIVTPLGWKFVDLTKHYAPPKRIIRFRDAEDYAKYVEHYKTSGTVQFISLFTAKTIFDYTIAGEGKTEVGECNHIAIYRSLTLNWHEERLLGITNTYKAK